MNISRSAEDANVFLVNDFQNPLQVCFIQDIVWKETRSDIVNREKEKEIKQNIVNGKSNHSHFIPRKNVDGIKKSKKRKDSIENELDNHEIIEIREKVSVTSLDIKS